MSSQHFEIAHVADSFATLRTFAAKSVDVIITDPPYPDYVQNNMKSGSSMRACVEAGGGPGGVHKVELPFDPLTSHGFALDMVRVARRWVLAFCAVEDFGNYRAAVTPENWVRGGIWYKPNSMGQLTGDRPAAAYEGLAIMHRRGRKQWNGRGSYGYWAAEDEAFPSDESHFVCNGTRGEPGRHPNQKPLELCLELVAKFSNRGETVLDLFCGSGRIGEACLALGRNYIGIDNDPGWCARANMRLAAPEVPFSAVSDSACLRLCAAPSPAQFREARGVLASRPQSPAKPRAPRKPGVLA